MVAGRSMMILVRLSAWTLDPGFLPSSVRVASSCCASSSSCALRALSTSHIGLKLLASMDEIASSPCAIKTGSTMVPYFLLPLNLIARPTAWMMSIWLFLGSMKVTPSSEGTSTPSDRHRALVKSPRSLSPNSLR